METGRHQVKFSPGGAARHPTPQIATKCASQCDARHCTGPVACKQTRLRDRREHESVDPNLQSHGFQSHGFQSHGFQSHGAQSTRHATEAHRWPTVASRARQTRGVPCCPRYLSDPTISGNRFAIAAHRADTSENDSHCYVRCSDAGPPATSSAAQLERRLVASDLEGDC
jgi:DNA-binding transcriptional LysR family regulator